MAKPLALNPVVKSRLDELTKTLVDKCGNNLVALVVHGSAVRGGWRDGISDVDLILVLTDDAEAALEAIGPALELARYSARIETMILVAKEIDRSADCFPLLYADIARASVTLAGKNPFETLEVPDNHKRVRIEQELREIRIRMRRVVTDMSGHANFGGAIDRKVKQARAPLYALLALRGQSVDDTLDAILRESGKAYAIDVAPLGRAHEAPKLAFQTLARLLDAALADVDSRAEGERQAP